MVRSQRSGRVPDHGCWGYVSDQHPWTFSTKIGFKVYMDVFLLGVPNLFWGGLKWKPQRNKQSEGQIDTHTHTPRPSPPEAGLKAAERRSGVNSIPPVRARLNSVLPLPSRMPREDIGRSLLAKKKTVLGTETSMRLGLFLTNPFLWWVQRDAKRTTRFFRGQAAKKRATHMVVTWV